MDVLIKFFAGSGGGITIAVVSAADRIEIEKVGNYLSLRVNGKKIKDSECLIEDIGHMKSSYDASILIKSRNDIRLHDFRHGGFLNTGNRIMLSYKPRKALSLDNYKQNACLLIDPSGQGDFSTIRSYPVSEIDTLRQRLIFNNVFFDTDENGEDLFTFGVKTSLVSQIGTRSADSSKKRITQQDTDVHKESYMRVYQNDVTNSRNVTVKVYLDDAASYALQVYDVFGRMIFRKEVVGNRNEQSTDILLPTEGLFVVNVVSKSFKHSIKLISDN